MSTYRVPPSLNWLLDNRRRIDGQIQKIEEKLAKFAKKYTKAKIIVDQHDIHLPRVMRALKADLKALDQTISLHQLAIDPASIPPIRERRPSRFGNMTSAIYECFSSAPRDWLTTNEIAAFVTSRRYPDIRDYEFPAYRNAVAQHLRGLLKRGQVEQAPAKGLGKQSLWRCKNPRVVTGLVVQGDGTSFPHRDSVDSTHETTATCPLEISDEVGPRSVV